MRYRADPTVVDPRLNNCYYSLEYASCDDVVTDALEEQERACDPLVLSGERKASEHHDCTH